MQKLLFIVNLLIVISCTDNNKNQVAEISQEKEMKNLVTQFPDSLLLKENLIQYYVKNGNYDMAIAIINEAIRQDSMNSRLWDIKAALHFDDEDTATAIQAYEKAIYIFPDPKYLMSLGSLYAETKNINAIKIADLLIEKKVHAEKEALLIKGLYYSYAGDKIKAIRFFDTCLHLNYTYMFAYREKAIALYDLGQYENALTVLDKALTLQNNFDEGYYWRGRCLEKLNKKEEAIAQYQSALAYNPDYIEAQDALAKLGIQTSF